MAKNSDVQKFTEDEQDTVPMLIESTVSQSGERNSVKNLKPSKLIYLKWVGCTDIMQGKRNIILTVYKLEPLKPYYQIGKVGYIFVNYLFIIVI